MYSQSPCMYIGHYLFNIGINEMLIEFSISLVLSIKILVDWSLFHVALKLTALRLSWCVCIIYVICIIDIVNRLLLDRHCHFTFFTLRCCCCCYYLLLHPVFLAHSHHVTYRCMTLNDISLYHTGFTGFNSFPSSLSAFTFSCPTHACIRYK